MIPGALSAATTTAPLLAPFPRAPEDPEHSFEANRERILITLLALDLMLMAFFVVMNSAATFDAKRGAQAAGSLAPAAVEAAKTEPPLGGAVPRVAASAQLRAAVTEVFDAFLPQGAPATSDADDGRVDVEMPGALAGTGALPEGMIAGLARVMENPPPGYKTELLIRAQDDPAKLARMAHDLAAGGIARDALSIGLPGAGEPAPLRFTFLLLEPGEETRAAERLRR